MDDMLRFIGGSVGKHEVGWDGPWPPPETMSLAHGRESGLVTVFVRENANADVLAALKTVASIVVTDYRRRNASILPDDIDRSRVFRGAEYVPETA